MRFSTVQIFAINWISSASSSVDKSPMTIMQRTVVFSLIKSCCTDVIHLYNDIIYNNNECVRIFVSYPFIVPLKKHQEVFVMQCQGKH
jgi:hypothetical protein